MREIRLSGSEGGSRLLSLPLSWLGELRVDLCRRRGRPPPLSATFDPHPIYCAPESSPICRHSRSDRSPWWIHSNFNCGERLVAQAAGNRKIVHPKLITSASKLGVSKWFSIQHNAQPLQGSRIGAGLHSAKLESHFLMPCDGYGQDNPRNRSGPPVSVSAFEIESSQLPVDFTHFRAQRDLVGVGGADRH
jgi:hypothetical protein